MSFGINKAIVSCSACVLYLWIIQVDCFHGSVGPHLKFFVLPAPTLSRKDKKKKLKDNISNKIIEKETIKIEVYNINRIKENNIKVKQLAEFDKLKRYNIIRM